MKTGNHQDIENALFQLENDLVMNVSLCISAEEGVILLQWPSVWRFPCEICKMSPPRPRERDQLTPLRQRLVQMLCKIMREFFRKTISEGDFGEPPPQNASYSHTYAV